jgi:oxygen-independent coproporphyrinogen III oxidase
MYPPRQAYRPFSAHKIAQVSELTCNSFRRFDSLNLYVHVPFCRQICSFCNLYAVAGAKDFDGYVDAVLAEAKQFADQTDRKSISTIYIGGGTPSLLSPAQIERLIMTLLDLFAVDRNSIPVETALEVDPATVTARILSDFRAAGVNRINLGYQSLVQNEVMRIGRQRSADSGIRLLENALEVGFTNVCVDLIYGLQTQTDENWLTSVERVAAVGPNTICAYALTLRPFTGYSRRGYDSLDGAMLYRRYDIVDQTLRNAGYKRETTYDGSAMAAATCRKSTTGGCRTCSVSARAHEAICGTSTSGTDTRFVLERRPCVATLRRFQSGGHR